MKSSFSATVPTIWTVLVTISLMITSNIAANKPTPLHRRCMQYDDGHGCLQYGNLYGCRATNVKSAQLRSSMDNYTCTTECPPPPSIMSTHIYREKLYAGGKYFSGVNVTWSTNKPYSYADLRGFLLELIGRTSDDKVRLIIMSLSVDGNQIPENHQHTQNLYGCRATNVKSAQLRSSMDNYTCTTECPPPPSIMSTHIYREKLYAGGKYFSGVNVTWSTNKPYSYADLRGFLLELIGRTSDDKVRLIIMSLSVDGNQIPENHQHTQILFHYDCLFPIITDTAWNLTIKSIPFNPDSPNHFSKTHFVLDENGVPVVMTTDPTAHVSTITTNATIKISSATTTVSPTMTSLMTSAVASSTMTSEALPEGQRVDDNTTSQEPMVMPSDIIITDPHRDVITVITSMMPTSPTEDADATSTAMVLLYNVSDGDKTTSVIGILIGVLSGVCGVIILMGIPLLMYCAHRHWKDKKNGKSLNDSTVFTEISPKSVWPSTLDNVAPVEPTNLRSVVLVHSQDSTALIKDHMTYVLTKMSEVTSIWEIEPNNGIDLHDAIVEVLKKADLIIVVSSAHLNKIADVLRQGCHLVVNVDVVTLDVLVNDDMDDFRSKICMVYFPSAKDFKLLEGLSIQLPIPLPLGLDDLCGMIKESNQPLHASGQLAGPESTLANYDALSVLVDNINENYSQPTSPVMLLKCHHTEGVERLESNESGFYEQMTSGLLINHATYDREHPCSIYADQGIAKTHICNHRNPGPRSLGYGNYVRNIQPSVETFVDKSCIDDRCSKCSHGNQLYHGFVEPRHAISIETMNESEYVADINAEHDCGNHQCGVWLPPRRSSLPLAKRHRSAIRSNSVSVV